ncbi:MAG TPA: diguanylate cyclase, partial [Gemmatimonadales bacterium]|nr:diguanylate cyclase [Gemmatimonadales bacterium]
PAAAVLEEGLERIAAAFDRAAGDPEGAVVDVRATGFGWRALVVGPGEELRAAIAERLGAIGFTARVADEPGDLDRAPLSERPDLVVVVARAQDAEADPYTLLAAAAGGAGAPRRTVALVDPASAIDRFRAAVAGAAAVFPGDRWEHELPGFAKALARIGAPPANVLLVEDDPALASLITGALEQAELRVRHCRSAESAYELLGAESPDLLLLDVRLPGLDGFALARLIRSDPRFSLIPIVFLTSRTSVEDQIEALRSGGDDFLTKPVDLHLLVYAVALRAERGRRIRELVHRDGLTGLLNHSALMTELEHAIAYSRRHGESLALLMIDLDHFKRINDRYGHLVGDHVLRHVARVFQRVVRSSDLLARYGGEEFAVLLRHCPVEGAALTAGKLREALEAHPAALPGGESVPVRASIGVALYPRDGQTVAALAGAADRALYRAKRAGRNRVEYAEPEAPLER